MNQYGNNENRNYSSPIKWLVCVRRNSDGKELRRTVKATCRGEAEARAVDAVQAAEYRKQLQREERGDYSYQVMSTFEVLWASAHPYEE